MGRPTQWSNHPVSRKRESPYTSRNSDYEGYWFMGSGSLTEAGALG